MLSEKNKYELLKDILNEFRTFNYSVLYSIKELYKILKDEKFINKKLRFKAFKILYSILSLSILSLVIIILGNAPQLNHVKAKFKRYETTAYTYVNGELTFEPQVDYIRDLERERIVYLDIVPVNELMSENANIYRYDVTNVEEKNISDYNNLYFDETSQEFVEKVAFNKNITDKSVPYKEVTIITQNKNKYVMDEDAYNNYKSILFESIIFSFFPLVPYCFLTKNYKDIKYNYEEELNSIYKSYIERYIDYKDYYKYMYEDLRKDVIDDEGLDYSFTSLYKDADVIETELKKINKLLRK